MFSDAGELYTDLFCESSYEVNNRLAAASKLFSVSLKALITASLSNPMAASCSIASSGGGGTGGRGGCTTGGIPPPLLSSAPTPPCLRLPVPLAPERRTALAIVTVGASSTKGFPNISPTEYTTSGNSVSHHPTQIHPDKKPKSEGMKVLNPPFKMTCAHNPYTNDFSEKSYPNNPKNLGCILGVNL
mmetsp:Transcript_20178/g.41990  ORF Transcript_20178/g.41990 Transcript_20178/m.41990 type:complete len:187 (-) Transcript_20178:551-1111(-)